MFSTRQNLLGVAPLFLFTGHFKLEFLMLAISLQNFIEACALFIDELKLFLFSFTIQLQVILTFLFWLLTDYLHS